MKERITEDQERVRARAAKIGAWGYLSDIPRDVYLESIGVREPNPVVDAAKRTPTGNKQTYT